MIALAVFLAATATTASADCSVNNKSAQEIMDCIVNEGASDSYKDGFTVSSEKKAVKATKATKAKKASKKSRKVATK